MLRPVPSPLRERVRVRAAPLEGSSSQLRRKCNPKPTAMELGRSRVQALTLTLSRRERGRRHHKLSEEEGTISSPAFLPTRQPHVVLWDTRKLDVSKDFAGGFGIGQYSGDGTLPQPHDPPFLHARRRPVGVAVRLSGGDFRPAGTPRRVCRRPLPADADL